MNGKEVAENARRCKFVVACFLELEITGSSCGSRGDADLDVRGLRRRVWVDVLERRVDERT